MSFKSFFSCVCILSSLNAPWAYHLWIRRNINHTYYYYYFRSQDPLQKSSSSMPKKTLQPVLPGSVQAKTNPRPWTGRTEKARVAETWRQERAYVPGGRVTSCGTRRSARDPTTPTTIGVPSATTAVTSSAATNAPGCSTLTAMFRSSARSPRKNTNIQDPVARYGLSWDCLKFNHFLWMAKWT